MLLLTIKSSMPSVFKLFPQQCCPVISWKIIWKKTAPTHKMILFVLLPSAPAVMSVINLSCSSTPRRCTANPKHSAFCGALLLGLNHNAWSVQGQCWSPVGSLAAAILAGSSFLPCGNPVEPWPHKWKLIQPFWSSTGILLCASSGHGALLTHPCFGVQAITAFSVWGQIMWEMPQNSECLFHVLLLLLSLSKQQPLSSQELHSGMDETLRFWTLVVQISHALWAGVCKHKRICTINSLLLWCKKGISFQFYV